MLAGGVPLLRTGQAHGKSSRCSPSAGFEASRRRLEEGGFRSAHAEPKVSVTAGRADPKVGATYVHPDASVRSRQALKVGVTLRRSEEGSGRSKAVLSLAFLAAIVFVAVKITPAYVDNFQLEVHIQQLSYHLAARSRPVTADEVRDEVVAFAQGQGIPLTADNVKVTLSSQISISLDYKVLVDLKVHTLMLHFTPSAESRSL